MTCERRKYSILLVLIAPSSFSLGILFFELFFSTASSATFASKGSSSSAGGSTAGGSTSSREVVLRELRHRVLPPHFLKYQVSVSMRGRSEEAGADKLFWLNIKR